MNSFQGKKNIYTCAECKHFFVTVDKDHGVTPFMTKCKAKNCNGTAYSSLYRVDQELKPTHEWYRGNEVEIMKMRNAAACMEHHMQGGLFLREIKNEHK